MHSGTACRRLTMLSMLIVIASLPVSFDRTRAVETTAGQKSRGESLSITPRQSTLLGRRTTAQLIASSQSRRGEYTT